MSLTVNGDKAVEQLGNGEIHTLSRVPDETTDAGPSWWWLWLLLPLPGLILVITVWLTWRRRHRRST
jgi:hypothetical protein